VITRQDGKDKLKRVFHACMIEDAGKFQVEPHTLFVGGDLLKIIVPVNLLNLL
jgi:hypothetical protein